MDRRGGTVTRDDETGDETDDETGDAVDEWDELDGDMSAPDTEPRHLDPAGDLADAVADRVLEISLADDQDVDELREFVERAEAGEFDPVDPGLEAQVRIARSLLEAVAGGESDQDQSDAGGEGDT